MNVYRTRHVPEHWKRAREHVAFVDGVSSVRRADQELIKYRHGDRKSLPPIPMPLPQPPTRISK